MIERYLTLLFTCLAAYISLKNVVLGLGLFSAYLWILVLVLIKKERKCFNKLRLDVLPVLAKKLDPHNKYPLPKLVQVSLLRGVEGLYNGSTNTIGSVYDPSFDKLQHILAHEMRHWWQFQIGDLEIIKITKIANHERCFEVIWKGVRKEYVVESYEDYLNLPWEVDARRWARDVAIELGLDHPDIASPEFLVGTSGRGV